MRQTFALLAVLALGCAPSDAPDAGEQRPALDGGADDAGAQGLDAGDERDAGFDAGFDAGVDAGRPDAGALGDAGATDAGPSDGGPDAGGDAGAADGGASDAGVVVPRSVPKPS